METVWIGVNDTTTMEESSDSFALLSIEEINRLNEIWGEEKEKVIFKELDVYGDFQNNIISREDKLLKLEEIQIEAFLITQQRFFDEFGVIPIKESKNLL